MMPFDNDDVPQDLLMTVRKKGNKSLLLLSSNDACITKTFFEKARDQHVLQWKGLVYICFDGIRIQIKGQDTFPHFRRKLMLALIHRDQRKLLTVLTRAPVALSTKAGTLSKLENEDAPRERPAATHGGHARAGYRNAPSCLAD